eukprot:14399177-Alexandrium_andersonii.AAC.1
MFAPGLSFGLRWPGRWPSVGGAPPLVLRVSPRGLLLSAAPGPEGGRVSRGAGPSVAASPVVSPWDSPTACSTQLRSSGGWAWESSDDW